ncbi:MAG: hypothetical protein WD604_17110 [Balneolaceae bacterium]
MTYSKQISLLLIRKKASTADEIRTLRQFAKKFTDVVCVRKLSLKTYIPCSSEVLYAQNSDLTDALNRAYKKIKTKWVFLLESDEVLQDDQILQKNLDSGCCYRVLISNGDGKQKLMNYDLRLIPVLQDEKEPFEGSFLPDLTRFFFSSEFKLAETCLPVQKKDAFMDEGMLQNIIESDQRISPMEWYWRGIFHSNKNQYSKAIQAFRKALQHPLISYYHLSALNGLAHAYAKTDSYDEALRLADQSLKLEKHQFAPYLIKHKVYWLQKNWSGASAMLSDYLQTVQNDSNANLDVYLEPAEAHYILAELGLLLHNREDAFTHFEKVYHMRPREADEYVREKLFIYAVELQKKEKATTYFHVLFANIISKDMDEKSTMRVLGGISLFEEKGWNQIACQLYEKLFQACPDSQKIMRRWMITLLRTNQVHKARQAAKTAGI